MNLLAATETVGSEALQQIASNGGGIPNVAIYLFVVAALIVLVILIMIISKQKKTESKPVSQRDQKKKEKIEKDKEMKKQKVDEKRFMEKPSGLPEDNIIGKTAKKKEVKSTAAPAPAPAPAPATEPAPAPAPAPALAPAAAPAPAPTAKTVIVEDSNRKAEYNAVKSIVIHGTSLDNSYEVGDKVILKFPYSIATELGVKINPELFSLDGNLSNVQVLEYDGETITVEADCISPFSLAGVEAKPVINKASVLAGEPEIDLKIYLQHAVR